MWIIELKFSPKDHGRPDPRTWRRASLQSCCGLYFSGAGKNTRIPFNYIGKTQKLLQKKLGVLSFSVLCSICFHSCVFFFVFFSFVFSIIVVFFSVFWSDLAKTTKCKKPWVFFSFSFLFFRFICFFIFHFFRIIFKPKHIFNLFSNPEKIDLFSNEKLNYFRTWSTCWFCFRFLVRLPQWSSRPWQCLLQQPKIKPCFGNIPWRWQTNLIRYGFDKIGDDFVMFGVMMKMIIHGTKSRRLKS